MFCPGGLSRRGLASDSVAAAVTLMQLECVGSFRARHRGVLHTRPGGAHARRRGRGRCVRGGRFSRRGFCMRDTARSHGVGRVACEALTMKRRGLPRTGTTSTGFAASRIASCNRHIGDPQAQTVFENALVGQASCLTLRLNAHGRIQACALMTGWKPVPPQAGS